MARAASDILTTPIVSSPRRGLRREAAAGYVGVSPSTFDQLVKDKTMPEPGNLRGCVLWDIRQLDLALDDIFEKRAASKAAEDDWSGAAA